MHIHDLIGIGFGPSNIALAIAMEEQHADAVDMLFIEKQPAFAWHGNMLLDGAHMQISFLKDLATPRNPASRFTFLNYLHEKRRLQDFINLKTFYPSRHEFSDYLNWAAEQFAPSCAYGEEVIEVLPERRNDEVPLLRVRSRDSAGVVQERLTRNLVVSVGGAPNIPDSFLGLGNDARIFHSSQYLSGYARQHKPQRVAVVGAGQSATEIFLDLHARGGMQVDFITRARAIKPSDDSPFVNEIFNPDYTDYVFNHPDDKRGALLEEFMNTNYAAPDLDLIEQIYHVFYKQKVTGKATHRYLRRHDIDTVRTDAEGVHLTLHDLDSGALHDASYDAVVLATGYTRAQHLSLLAPLEAYLPGFRVDRNYRVASTANFKPAIYLQGCCETTHGLSDTLLSVTAIRTNEIRQALVDTGMLAGTPPLMRVLAGARND